MALSQGALYGQHKYEQRCQNKTFNHTYLKKHHGSSLTEMLSILIEEYFPEQYER